MFRNQVQLISVRFRKKSQCNRWTFEDSGWMCCCVYHRSQANWFLLDFLACSPYFSHKACKRICISRKIVTHKNVHLHLRVTAITKRVRLEGASVVAEGICSFYYHPGSRFLEFYRLWLVHKALLCMHHLHCRRSYCCREKNSLMHFGTLDAQACSCYEFKIKYQGFIRSYWLPLF